MSDESGVLTAVGKSDGIKEKTQGWYEVEVAVTGKQWPLRLATKSSTLLDSVRETNGQVATWHYTERESSKTNPNTGNPYTNRYLESVEVGVAAGAENATGTAGGSDRMSKEEWNAKDRRDFRSRAWAQTISAFAHTIEADTDPLLAFAKMKPFQRKLYEDIVQDLDPKAAQQQTIDEPEPPEDDIPF